MSTSDGSLRPQDGPSMARMMPRKGLETRLESPGNPPRAIQERPKTSPRGDLSRSTGATPTLIETTLLDRRPPGCIQDGPKRAPKGPQTPPRKPQRLQNSPERGPRWLQASKRLQDITRLVIVGGCSGSPTFRWTGVPLRSFPHVPPKHFSQFGVRLSSTGLLTTTPLQIVSGWADGDNRSVNNLIDVGFVPTWKRFGTHLGRRSGTKKEHLRPHTGSSTTRAIETWVRQHRACPTVS